MKVVLVTGSRAYTDKATVRRLIVESEATVIIEGGAKGADRLAREVAIELQIPFRTYDAKWSVHGNAAGPLRNQEMLDKEPDIALVLAFPLPQSRGTYDMMERAAKKHIEIRQP